MILYHSGMCSLYASTFVEPTREQRQQLFARPVQTTTTEQNCLSSSGDVIQLGRLQLVINKYILDSKKP